MAQQMGLRFEFSWRSERHVSARTAGARARDQRIVSRTASVTPISLCFPV
jgi:hypothetical protein